MKDISYWLDMPRSIRSTLQEKISADVVIVGGGITGISAAYHCAKAGFSTILIEKNNIASGSAGKNGGMVVEGLAIDFAEAVEQFGKQQAKEIWERTIDTREYVASLINEYDIDCDFSRPGSLYVGTDTPSAEWIREELAARKDSGFSGEIISEPNPEVGSLFVPKDCLLHPVKFLDGLAAAAEKLGATIYEQTPAISWTADSVITQNGTIHAKKVIIAIESEKQDLSPHEGVVKKEMAMVTEPLSDDDLKNCGWDQGGMLWTLGGRYISSRKIGNRLFINGGMSADPDHQDLDDVQKKSIETFLSVVSALSSEKINISHRWTGLLLYPNRKIPFIKETAGCYELFGNGGNGLTNGIMLGKMITEFFQGNEIPEVYKGNV